MSQPIASLPTVRRPLSLILGVLFSILVGIAALLSASVGLRRQGSAVDNATAWPNLLTGVASLLGAIAYLRLKRWALPVYTVAVAGHWFSHLEIARRHWQAGRGGPVPLLILAVVPMIALAILLTMIRQRREGLLF